MRNVLPQMCCSMMYNIVMFNCLFQFINKVMLLEEGWLKEGAWEWV